MELRALLIAIVATMIITSLCPMQVSQAVQANSDEILLNRDVVLQPGEVFSFSIPTRMEVIPLYGNVSTDGNVTIVICPEWQLEEILEGTASGGYFEENYMDVGDWCYKVGYSGDNQTWSFAVRNNDDIVVHAHVSILRDNTAPRVRITCRIGNLFPGAYEVDLEIHDTCWFNYWILLNQNITRFRVRGSIRRTFVWDVSGKADGNLTIRYGAVDYAGHAMNDTYPVTHSFTFRRSFVLISLSMLLVTAVAVEIKSVGIDTIHRKLSVLKDSIHSRLTKKQ